eukprot:m.830840 g.830840  ORF g.830840 m.830840 type:complete len:108 (-) comp23426_c0_seq2:2680-3003(-)
MGKGLVILGFPCNQFAMQEPGSACKILKFSAQHNTGWHLMAKIHVNGTNTHPIFAFLKKRLKGSFGNFIKWNYTKFLIDANGDPFKRYGPNVAPLSLAEDIQALIHA